MSSGVREPRAPNIVLLLYDEDLVPQIFVFTNSGRYMAIGANRASNGSGRPCSRLQHYLQS